MYLEEVGEIYRRKRIEKGFTQAQATEKAGISEKAISNLENGKANMTMQQYERACEGIDCDIDLKLVEKPPKEHYINEKFVFPIPDDKNQFSSISIKQMSVVDLKDIPNDVSFDYTRSENIFGCSLFKSINHDEIKLQLLNNLLYYDVFGNVNSLQGKALKIEFDCSGNQNLLRKLIYDITLVILSLKIQEIHYDELLGCKSGFHVTKVFSKCTYIEDTVYLKFYDEITKEQMTDYVPKNITLLENKVEEKKKYMIRHPKGFTYICGLLSDLKEDFADYYRGFDTSSLFHIVEAWDEDEAIDRYLDSIIEDYIGNFYMNEFKERFVEYVIFGDIEEIISGNFVNDEEILKFIKNFCKKHLNDILGKNAKEKYDEDGNYIGTFVTLNDELEKELIDVSNRNISKEELLEVMGITNLRKFFKICYYDNVFVQLDKTSNDIFKNY